MSAVVEMGRLRARACRHNHFVVKKPLSRGFLCFPYNVQLSLFLSFYGPFCAS